jgi:hypothetical protein
MWLLIVTMLATLDIAKATDEYGNIIEPNVEFNDSVFRCVAFGVASLYITHISLLCRTPSPFKCSLTPRSEQAIRLIRQADSTP